MSSIQSSSLPEDFIKCIEFHGHSCPGLAIGYVASKLAQRELKTLAAEDEEFVAIVENDSCAVDAVQVLTGCTFGKGNFIFKDWGKQVFTFYDRASSRAVRISFNGEIPLRNERQEIKKKMDQGTASLDDEKRFKEINRAVVYELISFPDKFFKTEFITMEPPSKAVIVDTSKCSMCGEPVMTTRSVSQEGKTVCKPCSYQA
jgi:formylmethanofuran dehydrogenase subunit E